MYQLLPLLLEDESLVGVFSRHLDTVEQKNAKLSVYRLADLGIHYTHEFPVRSFLVDSVLLRDHCTVVAISTIHNNDHLIVLDVAEKALKHRFRPRPPSKRQQRERDMVVQRLSALGTSQCVVMDGVVEGRGVVWDVKQRRMMRHLTNFTEATEDGKTGLYAVSDGRGRLDLGVEVGLLKFWKTYF